MRGLTKVMRLVMGLGGVGGLRDDLLACSVVYSLAQLSFEAWPSLPAGLCGKW